jgi:hypothetical protein
VLQRLGLALAVAVSVQILLGFSAFLALRSPAGDVEPAVLVMLRTAHQGFGAVLLGLAVTLVCWSFRLVSQGPVERHAEASSA